jgi:PAS domain S-box-containing protein
VVVENISEKRAAENTLKESEEKYRTLVEQAVDGILIADLDGKIITANSACSVLSDYSTEELLQMTIYVLAIMEDLAKNPLQLETLKRGEPARSERMMKRKDGSVIQIEINAKMLLDGRVLIFIRDISERKKAQKKITESENRLRTILETEPECVKLLNQKGEIVEMNPAGLAMIEAESLEIIKGNSVINIINSAYKKAFSDLTKNVFEGKPGKLEFEITGLKGTQRWLETHAVPFKNTDGTIISLLGVTRDITLRKKAEYEILKLNRELEQRVKERTTELQASNAELEEINDLFVGRESRIIDLKEELEKIKNKIPS